MGHGVATAMEFYNGDDLLFPSFQYEPLSNLSSIIGFSLDNNSKVELSRDAEPVRIRFKQVTIITHYTKIQIIILRFGFSSGPTFMKSAVGSGT